MNRARLVSLALLTSIGASGVVMLVACEGGPGTIESAGDGGGNGSSGNTTPGANPNGSGGSDPTDPNDRSSCVKNVVTVAEVKKEHPSPSPNAECTKREDCTVTYEGDYCACPNPFVPVPLTTAQAKFFNDKIGSVKCTCPPSGCDGSVVGGFTDCLNGHCELVDANTIIDANTTSPDGG